jgi:hypothetical protein
MDYGAHEQWRFVAAVTNICYLTQGLQDVSHSECSGTHRRVTGRCSPHLLHNGPAHGCCCFYLPSERVCVCVCVCVCVVRRRGRGRGRRRSGRVPPVAPPLLHATGACLLGLNPGVQDTEFRRGPGLTRTSRWERAASQYRQSCTHCVL